jgi:hypothetical protein
MCLELAMGADIPLVQPHVLRDESLQMKDLFATQLAPMFVEGCPLDHLGLQRIIRLRYQLPCERLDDGCAVYAMREQVVEGGADL